MKSYIKGNRRIDLVKEDNKNKIKCYINSELLCTIDYNQENKELAMDILNI